MRLEMIQRSSDEKAYKTKWLEAERELAIRGIRLQPPIPPRRVSTRISVNKVPLPARPPF